MSKELREEFESWALSRGMYVAREHKAQGYADSYANHMWIGWQAAIAYIRQHDDWQPIETAPKDYVTTVDLWNGERQANCFWGRPTYWDKESGYQWVHWTGDDSDGPVWETVRPDPTHWMPLPEPPK